MTQRPVGGGARLGFDKGRGRSSESGTAREPTMQGQIIVAPRLKNHRPRGFWVVRLPSFVVFAAVLAPVLAMWPAVASSASLELAVWSEDPPVTEAGGRLLAAYLREATGIEVRAVHAASALEHWQATRLAPRYDVALDGAQFSDYRVRRFGYRVVAKLAGQVGYTVVTAPGMLITDAEELAGRAIAAPPAPALAALSLLNLYPDSVRAPRLVAVRDFAHGVARLLTGRVVAAVVPSSFLVAGSQLNPVLETEKMPAAAFSIAARVDRRRGAALSDALLSARATPAGRKMLAGAGLRGFVPASATLYSGYARLLAGAWGYRQAQPERADGRGEGGF